MLNPSASLRINSVKHLAGRYSPTPDSSLTLRMTCAANFKDATLFPPCKEGRYFAPFVVSLSNHETSPFDMLRANGN